MIYRRVVHLQRVLRLPSISFVTRKFLKYRCEHFYRIVIVIILRKKYLYLLIFKSNIKNLFSTFGKP